MAVLQAKPPTVSQSFTTVADYLKASIRVAKKEANPEAAKEARRVGPMKNV